MDKSILSEKIRELADASGIDALGFASAAEFTGYALTQSKRRDPKHSMPDAETIIVAGVYIGGLTLPVWSDPLYGRTSRLYLSGYFSDVIEPLEPIVNYLKEQGYKAILCNSSTGEGSIIPLKLAGIRAGLGWQGKHSLLVTKKFGTFLALGGIVTNAVLEHNEKEEPNRCGKCNKCQVACPLSAFERPYVLNRIKCLSSNLLQDGGLSAEFQVAMENRIGDCEICQDACPWNKKHLENPLQTKLTKAFREQEKTWKELFYLPSLEKLNEDEYNNSFVGRVKTGIPYETFHRNVKLALEKKTAQSRKEDDVDNKNMPQSKDELMEQIEREWEALLRTAGNLTPEQMIAPDIGSWSPKDNLAHVAIWEQYLIRCILQGQPLHEVLQIDEASLERLDQDGVNQILVERGRLRSVKEVLEELRQSHALTLNALEQMTFADLMQPNPMDTEGKPLIIWVMGNTYQHYHEHQRIIQAILQE